MEQIELIRLATQTLDTLAIPYAVVGSWGSGIYGEPRFTRDIDIVLDLNLNLVPQFCAAFPNDEFYLSEAAVRDAVRTRFQFNLIHPGSGNKIDFILTRPESWNAGQLERRRRIELRIGPEAFDVYIAAPEDVILGKLWYFAQGGGDRHLRDIAGILRVTGAGVNRAEVERWATKLGYLEIWQQIVAKVDAPDAPPGPGTP
jgi:Nucleotidyl transferase AbiEii toxin, Type IV TA system